MNDEKGKLIFWRRMAPKLKTLTNQDNLKDSKKLKIKKANQKTVKKATKVTTTKTLLDKLKKNEKKII